MSLQGKVVVITGASAGIGKETALALGKEKASVVISARRTDRLQEIARQIEQAGGTALAVTADVSDETQVQKIVAETLARFGRIDVWINNAGMGLYATLEETSAELMEKIWKTNFMSTFYGIHHVVPVMKRQKAGHIITVSSVVGKRATPLNAAYCSTKFGQVGLMESARMELRKFGIHCSLIYPGSTESEFIQAQENPAGRPVRRHGPVQTSEQVAKEILKAIRRPRAEIMTQSYGRLMTIMNSISPSLLDWVISKTVKRKEVGEL
jgi:short-subunit dehydrogenase